MWRYGWEPLIVSHHLVKIGDNKHNGSKDIMFFIFHAIKSNDTLLVGAPQSKSTSWQRGGHKHCGSGGMFFLSLDLGRPRAQRVMWLYGWKPHVVSHHSAKFGVRRHCANGDETFLLFKEQDFTCSLKSASTVCFWSKWHVALTHTEFQNLGITICHTNKSHISHTRLQQQQNKNKETIVSSVFKFTVEK